MSIHTKKRAGIRFTVAGALASLMATKSRISRFHLALLVLPLAGTASTAIASDPAQAAAAVGVLPHFERNAGQADARARFLLRTQRGTFFFTPSEIVLASPTAANVSRQQMAVFLAVTFGLTLYGL